ncbi:MAG: putative DNA binding domain-containing protein [Acidobacteria bacterium]|nr:putative DNA binding domain-containing protein [Acidobacteriota bacterium]
MIDTRDQILNQLRAGEDRRAEFEDVRLGKRGVVAPNAEELPSELVAFANAEGRVVFLGVDDAGAVRGIEVERMDMVESWI